MQGKKRKLDSSRDKQQPQKYVDRCRTVGLNKFGSSQAFGFEL